MTTISRSQKVLIAVQEGCSNYAGTTLYMQTARDLLTRMGYTVHINLIANDTSYPQYNGNFFEPNGSQGTTGIKYWELDSDDYDFVIIPRYTGTNCESGSAEVPEEWIKTTRRDIPIFCEAFDDGRTGFFVEQFGADASERTSNTYQFCTYAGPYGEISVGEYTHSYPALSAETANIEELVTVSTGAQTGDLVAWIHRPSGISPVYASAAQFTTVRRWFLPILLAEAVRRGDIPAPPNKIPLFHDFDDMPAVSNTQAEVEFVIDLMNSFSIPGTWGIHAQDGAGNFAALPAAIQALVLANQVDSGGLIYPIDHNGNDFASTTPATITSAFEDFIGRMQGWGFTTGTDVDGYDQWGYRYFSNHNVGPQAISLMEDWGHRVIRVNDSSTDANALKGRGFGAQRAKLSSIDLLGYSAYGSATADSTDAETRSSVVRALLLTALVGNYALSIHGDDFYDGHDSGTAGGQWQFQLVADLAKAMNTICEWKHPGEVF